jgi:hypothetical protein
LILYVVAVRKTGQMVYAWFWLRLFGTFFVASSAKAGSDPTAGISGSPVAAPGAAESGHWWWKPDYERYLRVTKLKPDPGDPQSQATKQRGLGSTKQLQQSQGLFGTQ